jgi:hypothetical protein
MNPVGGQKNHIAGVNAPARVLLLRGLVLGGQQGSQD